MDIEAEKLGLTRGKPYRVVMRLGDGYPTTASEKLWVKWELVYVDAGGVERVLYETPGVYLATTNELIMGPVVNLPPWQMAAGSPALRLVLKATAAGAGAHALKLDYVDLCPLDGWRLYEPILQSYGLSVNDTGLGGVTGPVDGVITHAMDGPGFLIRQRSAVQFQFYFSLKEAAEVSASANLAGTVSIYYRPRKRTF